MVDLSITEPMAAASGGGGGQQDAAAGGGAAAAAAGAAASGVAAGQALTGNTYEVGSGSLLVPLLKDEAGALRVQLEMPEERPDINDSTRTGSTRLNGKGARTLLVGGARRVHALLLQLQRRQLVLVIVRDGRTDVEGVVAPSGPPAAGSGAGGSRWVRDTLMAFTRHDVPAVLRSLLQTLGLPLDKLLGVTVPAHFAPHHHYSHGALAALTGGTAAGAGASGPAQPLPKHEPAPGPAL
eukprot:XP_001692344.1 predicted protein [Chlamydomonas reinhardtii]